MSIHLERATCRESIRRCCNSTSAIAIAGGHGLFGNLRPEGKEGLSDRISVLGFSFWHCVDSVQLLIHMYAVCTFTSFPFEPNLQWKHPLLRFLVLVIISPIKIDISLFAAPAKPFQCKHSRCT